MKKKVFENFKQQDDFAISMRFFLTGETRLRESQSLNRITEVQESEGHNYANTEIFHERLRKTETENEKNYERNVNNNNNNNNNILLIADKGKSGKSLGARFLQSWSNTLSSTKLSVSRRKYLADGRNARGGVETSFAAPSEQTKHDSDEKENKVVVEKSGKKVKLLGRYFQVRLFRYIFKIKFFFGKNTFLNE